MNTDQLVKAYFEKYGEYPYLSNKAISNLVKSLPKYIQQNIDDIIIIIDEISRIIIELNRSDDFIQGYKDAVALTQELYGEKAAYYEEEPYSYGHEYNFNAEAIIPFSDGSYFTIFDVGYTGGRAGWFRQEGWLFEED